MSRARYWLSFEHLAGIWLSVTVMLAVGVLGVGDSTATAKKDAGPTSVSELRTYRTAVVPQQAETQARVSSAATESISISWSKNKAPTGDWMTITWRGFAKGTISWACVEGGTKYGPYSTDATSRPFTASKNTCYDTTKGDKDYVVTDGVASNVIRADATTSIKISWGSNAAPAGNWMDITFVNFPTGPVSWYCVEEGTSYGPYSTTLSSSPETLTSNTCYDTEPGGSDYVTADGVTSNTIPTD